MPLTDDDIKNLNDLQLLDAIIEEASEIIYAACKAKRFGLHDTPLWPNAPKNIDEILDEAVQIRRYSIRLGANHGISDRDVWNRVHMKATAQKEKGIGFQSHPKQSQHKP